MSVCRADNLWSRLNLTAELRTGGRFPTSKCEIGAQCRSVRHFLLFEGPSFLLQRRSQPDQAIKVAAIQITWQNRQSREADTARYWATYLSRRGRWVDRIFCCLPTSQFTRFSSPLSLSLSLASAPLRNAGKTEWKTKWLHRSH